VLMHIAREKRKQHLREVKKQKQEVALGTKRKASEMNGECEMKVSETNRNKASETKVSGYKHVFWHDQSQCWRALVKKTSMKNYKPGRKVYEHFKGLKDAVKAVSDGLGIPAHELKKPEEGGDEKMASLYDGVFYDTRKCYKKMDGGDLCEEKWRQEEGSEITWPLPYNDSCSEGCGQGSEEGTQGHSQVEEGHLPHPLWQRLGRTTVRDSV